MYQLETQEVELQTEGFGVRRVEAFQNLLCRPELPVAVVQGLSDKKSDIARYMEGLKIFSDACKGNQEDFHK